MVVLVAGTGNPYFTTDTAATLRAVEIGAEVILKATRVDGVYDADPEKEPGARRYEQIGYTELLSQPAAGARRDRGEPGHGQRDADRRVRHDACPATSLRAVRGEPIGTLIGEEVSR